MTWGYCANIVPPQIANETRLSPSFFLCKQRNFNSVVAFYPVIIITIEEITIFVYRN
jgi:hypothetical protein